MSKKRVYLFKDGNATMRDLLGGKGANLAEMTNAGLPVPPGFTLTTETCNDYLKNNMQFPDDTLNQVKACLAEIEKQTGKKFGNPSDPLLVSVRSGAKFSMPGMMETVLNLGLNDDTIKGVIAKTNDERFAYDSYRRFLQMFGSVVLDIERENFEEHITELKEKKNIKLDVDLSAADWKDIVAKFKEVIKRETGKEFPQEPFEQLKLSIEAVFKSWNIPRAVAYRNYNKISHDLGTAVNVQTMVFGNMGNDSATGVAFTRNPATGENKLYGEYLTNAQGEDVVAGIRTPNDLSKLEAEMPAIYKEFSDIAKKLETHYKDVQDLEFTVEQGKLYMLQTRNGKRTAGAAVRIAVEMKKEGVIDKNRALQLVDPNQLTQLMLRSFDMKAKDQAKKEGKHLATGLNASPGAATGIVVFNPDEAEERANAGEKIILVRIETCPDDIHGIIPAQGVLTSRGGMTSHAAVVARGMGKPCVAGCESAKVDLKNETLTAGGKVLRKGDIISLDGTTGEVYEGSIDTVEPKLDQDFETLLQWADEVRRLGVRTNADTPEDAKKAIEFGAQGIGLCRTEHMFMAQDRLPVMQEMILAQNEADRRKVLDKLLPFQKEDFVGIFRAMAGFPVTIRLLDPPLHEFLPNHEELLEEVVILRTTGKDPKKLEEKESLLKTVSSLSEANPMMGLRGCRLGLTYPEINDMQTKAIIQAACELKKEGVDVLPEIMIPLIGHVNELKVVRDQLEKVAKETMDEMGVQVNYLFGTMIEIPRAALTADEIAEHAEFFSFGTNDLTQMTFGFSRDDAEGKFLGIYVDKKILKNNPFEVLDTEGVGILVKMAIDKGRQTRPNIKLGICGEHGGEPQSVAFCHKVGLNYVSCSPFRVPVARLAAAQAVLSENSAREVALATA
ncbi:MAG: pyruvate, phosphate dikinase [Cyanobacteriota bacterium]